MPLASLSHALRAATAPMTASMESTQAPCGVAAMALALSMLGRAAGAAGERNMKGKRVDEDVIFLCVFVFFFVASHFCSWPPPL